METGIEQQRRPPRGQPRKDLKGCTRRGYAHKSVGGAETLGVGGLNLPMKKN